MHLPRWSSLVTVNSLALATLLVAGARAQEDYTTVGFVGNAVLQDLTIGGAATNAYPSGNVLLGGVPFNIPTTGNNFWSAHVASGGTVLGTPGDGGTAGTVSLTVPIGVYGVNEVDTLINTYWGQVGSTTASLTFTGSGGATFTKILVGGTDIRDWNNDGGAYADSINGTTTTQVFSSSVGDPNGYRLDKQQILLPSIFGTQTLETMTLTDSGAPFVQRTFLAGATVGTFGVPETGSLCIGIVGLLCGGMLLRQQRQRY